MAARVSFGRREWLYVLRRTGHSLIRVRLIDSAAALTFFSAITLFPGALAVLSAFALGRGDNAAIGLVQDVTAQVVGADAGRIVREALEQLTRSDNPGWTLTIGIVLLLSTASAYATAFGRATNTFYGVQEGRRIWKFRGLMIIVAAILIAGMAVAIPLLMGTPTVAAAAADVLGIGEPWITVWSVGRWPVLIALGSALIALLYFWTPTIERQSVPLFSWGSLIALIGWGIATGLFVFYVTRFAHYGETYGWLGGALVLLLWLYLSNFVILLGAVLDAEIVRMRQLLDGIPSEEVIKVPMRDTARNLVIARSLAADEREGREIREAADRLRHGEARHL
ncbi:MAG: YihY/virulence factor BrkB family protein [Naasia sp.]